MMSGDGRFMKSLDPAPVMRAGPGSLSSGYHLFEMPPMAADASSAPRPTLNVLGTPLACCCLSPLTGFYRDGDCRTGPQDVGRHLVCAQVTAEFLAFSVSVGNDLSTPRPEYQFPGLKPGDKWCLCVLRWKQALDAGLAPPIVLAATHQKALEYVDLAVLSAHALDQA